MMDEQKNSYIDILQFPTEFIFRQRRILNTVGLKSVLIKQTPLLDINFPFSIFNFPLNISVAPLMAVKFAFLQ